MGSKKKQKREEDEFEDPQIEQEEAFEDAMDCDDDDFGDVESYDDDGWELPDDGDSEADEDDEDEVESFDVGSIDARVLSVHKSICGELQRQVQLFGEEPRAESEEIYEGAGNILGVGIGAADDDPLAAFEPGSDCVNVYVAEACSEEEARRMMFDSMSIQAAQDDDMPINVIVTGPIDANAHRFRIRPAPGGVSCGHTRVTAGTLGCLARGRDARRRRRMLMLSNNHVIANSNNARFGDSIIQPGTADGGRNPRDRIAILERFVRIHFNGRPNLVDAATGWCWPKRVRRELVYLRRGRRRYFRVGNRPVNCRWGMIVGKSGRTTQLTAGMVRDCSATIRVNYGGGRVALFRDQIAIRGLRGNFSAGGDSGSLVWNYRRPRNPVGLLFAGGGGVTFANKIHHVLRALNISLWT